MDLSTWDTEIAAIVSDYHIVPNFQPFGIFVEPLVQPSIESESLFANRSAQTEIAVAFDKSWYEN